MNVVICDDDGAMLCVTKKLVEVFFKDEECNVTTFSYTKDFIEFFANGGCADIIVMDIELDVGNDGVQVIKSLHDKINNTRVIYLTGFVEYASSVYETEHEYFVLKSQMEQYFEKALIKAHKSLIQNPDKLYIESRFAKVFIDCEDILYIERNKRTTTVVCMDASYQTSEKLDSVLKRLSEDLFIRCHNSYAVNARKVKVYTNNIFMLVNGSSVKVTRSYKKYAEDKFLAFIRNSFSN